MGNCPLPLDFVAQTWYSERMNNETTLPVYETLAELLAAEVPELRAHVQNLVLKTADKPLTVDQALALIGF